MKIVLINENKQTRTTFTNLITDVEAYETFDEFKNTYIKSENPYQFFDFLILDKITDAKEIFPLIENTKLIFWGTEPLGQEACQEFKDCRKFVHRVLAQTDSARFLLNVLLKEFITPTIPTFYIDSFKEGTTDKFNIPKILTFLENESDNDIDLFYTISKTVEENKDSKWFLVGNMFDHQYLQKLVYMFNLKDNVSYVDTFAQEESDTKKWLDNNVQNMTSCFVYTPLFNPLIRYPVQNGIKLFVPNVPDYHFMKDIENSVIDVGYYDENIKKMDFDKVSLENAIFYMTNMNKLKKEVLKQTKILKDKFIGKETLKEKWMNEFNNVEDRQLLSDITKEIVTIDNRGFFDDNS